MTPPLTGRTTAGRSPSPDSAGGQRPGRRGHLRAGPGQRVRRRAGPREPGLLRPDHRPQGRHRDRRQVCQGFHRCACRQRHDQEHDRGVLRLSQHPHLRWGRGHPHRELEGSVPGSEQDQRHHAGHHTADGVDLEGCRNDFMFSAAKPPPSPTARSTRPLLQRRLRSGDQPHSHAHPDPEPDAHPDPEPDAHPDPEPGARAAAPEFSGFPDASNTGVPEGVELQSSGSINVTQDGAVIDAMHVRGEIVPANNVTIRNTLIQSNTPPTRSR